MGSFQNRELIPIKNNKLKGPVYCVLAAMIWGLGFVSQKSGAHIGTLTFNGIRTLLGGLVLIPVVIYTHRKSNKALPEGEKKKFDFKGTLIGGAFCGLALCIAGNLQQHSFSFDIEAGKVGFITALYMILVPIFGLFLGQRPRSNVWLGVVFGIGGLYLLCMKKGSFAMGKGEFFAFLCAICFAIHILVIDYFCNKVENGVALSCFQFLVAGIISVIGMFIFEEPKLSDILDSAVPILYAGIGSCSFAFTLQIFGQRYTEPAVSSLLFCLESVFGVIFGWLILHDVLGTRALTGCIIMFIGVVLTQISFEKRGEKKLNG